MCVWDRMMRSSYSVFFRLNIYFMQPKEGKKNNSEIVMLFRLRVPFTVNRYLNSSIFYLHFSVNVSVCVCYVPCHSFAHLLPAYNHIHTCIFITIFERIRREHPPANFLEKSKKNQIQPNETENYSKFLYI